jgi:3-hydroxyisobutyrate dehydrogenase-like beta-hydroxyacid dehydrogenase
MGSRLARRLHSAGLEYSSMESQSTAGSSDQQRRDRIAPSVAELVADSDVILSSLANDAAVRVRLPRQGRRLFRGRAGNRHPRNEHHLAGAIAPPASGGAQEGFNFLDVAISGSTPAVDAGTITLLAGGDKETFEQCVPIFESIARQWFLIGPGSSGVQMKLVVNLLLGLDMQAIAEAVSLGEHLQIDRNVLLDVLSKTAVVAPAMAGKFRKIKDGDYSPEFPLRLMSKDMDLVMDAAKERLAPICLRPRSRPIRTCVQCLREWRSWT